ncbi:hypothetical protein LZQ00_15385 [Sphingobacterium sp. SRCM116780]|uniref:hypothetical protein n=1 Tax=Sphingobacterium sp. SRCM116780 TaxID=2907623 RepID=UPI001F19A9FB|nr:hypothetical protein [Sphingobacterium sp. SRCM116780]UIR55640.1 hypothetical protein LZQ00_15385 [Sphingobacterium sp. SRCM116780]
MKSPKKTTATSPAKAPIDKAKIKTDKKINLTHSVNFSVEKDINFEDLEIIITVKENKIIAKFLNQGVLNAHQVVLVKPKPTPPPLTPIEIINVIKRLRFNLLLKK